jgi:tRNA(fMet)-specific endonuclease VapC
MYLLDTDTCIHLARGNPDLLKKLRQKHRTDIRVAILTVYELELGVLKATLHKPEKRKALDNLLELFAIAPLDQSAACEAAKIRAELEKAGTPIGSIDYLIAGIARANVWTLVTGNLNEFRRVKRLKAETWHA